MADNVPITAGTGTSIATDDVGGIHYQITKQAFGVLDTATLVSSANPLPVTFSNATLAVTGTFYQATQPVSGAVTANAGTGTFAVSGAFYQATQPVSGTITANAGTGTFAVSIAAMPSTPVTGTFWQATQPISAASLPLPAGAATAAKQPALGTAGTASTDVITVQGIASGTALPVSGAFWQATQPVSGTVTANAGTGTFAISAASLPLPTGAATETTLAALNAKVTAVNTGAVTISAALPAGTNSIGAITVADTTSSGTIAAAAQNVALAMSSGMNAAAIQITGTWVGTLQFEGTVDGTNYVPINGVFAGSSTPGATITANGVVRLTPGGLTSIRINATAWTSGTATITMRAGRGTGGTFLNQSLTAGTNIIGKVGIDQTTPGTTNLVSLAAPSATYSAAIVGLTVAATATDIFTITGSATKTVKITRILVNGVQTTAAQVNILLVKRSTADTAGTSTAQTRIPYDSASAAATATVLAYTANPTLGTAVGTVRAFRLFIPGAATASDAQGLEVVSGDVGQQLMTLRGIAEVLAVSLNSTTITGGSLNVTVEWTES